jgi:hypothetical protein
VKIQCTCGAKYEFEVTPEMAQGGAVRFVCPACGLDASEFVTSLVRQQFGGSAPASAPLPVAQFAPAAPAGQPPPAVKPAPGLRIHAAPAAQEPSPAAAADEPAYCKKHPTEPATAKCYICSKPICPKCMELFGYVCGPLCKAKAESHGIALPVYEGQRSVIEARLWRKVCWVGGAAGIVAVAVLGVWFWYAWFGSDPKPIFSVRFPDTVHSGESYFCGTNQIVFLHGDTLARYDLAQQKEIWSRQLLDRKRVADRAAKLHKEMADSAARALQEWGPDGALKVPSLEKLTSEMEIAAIAELQLRAQGNNVWVAEPEKLVHYDWETGKPLKEIYLREHLAGMMPRGDEFLLIETDKDKPVITHIDLATGESRSEEIGGSAAPSVLAALKNSSGGGSGRGTKGEDLAGLPGAAGKDSGKAMDPAKVAEQAQHLSLPARIALPATLSINRNQERALAEMRDENQPKSPPAPKPEDEGNLSLIPTKTGFIEFTEKLLEFKMNERSAMRPAPARSALDGPVSVGNSGQVVNEILNQMQRERGGDKVVEDISRYRVTIRRPGVPEAWTEEVTGSPQLFPLGTVDVLSANKLIVVLDKQNKKLWQSTLNYNITGAMGTLDEENAVYGQGPCVEHQGALYVFDEGVLTAFDLASGNVRWRLPSVGIIGLFFDDRGMIYLNTTTASPETLKFSRQIDIGQRTSPIVVKIDAKTGKQLWREQVGGFINYVSGKFIYSVSSYQPEEDDEFGAPDDRTPPYMRIKRINPRNGTPMWEHFQQRCPLDVQFDKNTIRIVFRKEVQVLRFLAL